MLLFLSGILHKRFRECTKYLRGFDMKAQAGREKKVSNKGLITLITKSVGNNGR
jgi:hypothetical protein